MAQEREVDIRAQGILKGLSELRALLEEPITRHALDLANNAKTASQHDILKSNASEPNAVPNARGRPFLHRSTGTFFHGEIEHYKFRAQCLAH